MGISKPKNILNSNTCAAYCMKQCLEKLWHLTLDIKLTTCQNFFIKNSFFDTSTETPALECVNMTQFDYAGSVWYPNLAKKLKHNLNKCMRFC